MASNLFDDVTHTPERLGSRRWYTLPLSILTHTVAIGAILVIPLIATGELPAIRRAISFGDIEITPVVPPPPPPARRGEAPRTNRVPAPSTNVAPVVAPPTIEPEVFPEAGTDIGDADGVTNGVVGGFSTEFNIGGLPAETLTPVVPQGPIRITKGVTPPRRIVYVQPVYPSIAQANRISGRVVIEAIIGPTGDVRSTRLLQSVPFLNDAALTAVRQWRYTPTLLNGVPVSVILTVSVDFTLQ